MVDVTYTLSIRGSAIDRLSHPYDAGAAGSCHRAAAARLLLPVKVRRGIFGFLRNHPTVAVGGALLLLLVLIGVFAPYLGTVDPTALAPAKRTRAPSADFWFGHRRAGPRHLFTRALRGAGLAHRRLSVALFASLAGLAIGLVSASCARRRHPDAVHGWTDVDTRRSCSPSR